LSRQSKDHRAKLLIPRDEDFAHRQIAPRYGINGPGLRAMGIPELMTKAGKFVARQRR
jgi:hypothetical protein